MTAFHVRPSVSIVRAVDRRAAVWADVARARLGKHTPAPCEVIDAVVDGSFAAAVNRAVVASRAEHVVVMRGDTLAGPGWLEPLLSTSSRHDAVAAPCLEALDGSVLDAGLAATRGGDLVPIARGSTKAESAWSFVREVSSPSPACFSVARRAFLAAGGFDLSFGGDALVETADLAFRLRARGSRVLFHPDSRLQSAEVRGPATAFPLGRAFRTRWAGTLNALPPYAGSTATRGLIELRDGHVGARVLVIDDRVPHVDRGGGDPRMHRILAELGTWPEVRVTLFALMPDNGEAYALPLRRAGIEVVYGVALDRWLSERRYLFDVVAISRPRAVLEQVRASQPQARLVYDMEAVHFRRSQRMIPLVELDDARRMTQAVKEQLPIEVGLVAEADAVLCVSEDDRTFARSIAPATPAFVVAHASEPPRSVPSFEERADLLFFGAFWNPGSPNEDAVLHLVRQIMPAVWAEDSSIRLVIIGADPTPAVLRLEGPRVMVRGYVSDPNELLTRARVHVVPIRMGAGIKLRLIDSMAAGLPFVTTTVGAEGLPLGAIAPLVVADSPEEIARRALALYRHRQLWDQVQRSVRQIAGAHYSAAALRRQLVEAMAAVGIASPADHAANACASPSADARAGAVAEADASAFQHHGSV